MALPGAALASEPPSCLLRRLLACKTAPPAQPLSTPPPRIASILSPCRALSRNGSVDIPQPRSRLEKLFKSPENSKRFPAPLPIVAARLLFGLQRLPRSIEALPSSAALRTTARAASAWPSRFPTEPRRATVPAVAACPISRHPRLHSRHSVCKFSGRQMPHLQTSFRSSCSMSGLALADFTFQI